MSRAFFSLILTIVFGIFTGVAMDLKWEHTADAAGLITTVMVFVTMWLFFEDEL